MSMRLKKVCPQCDATLHARKLACPCGYVFPAKAQQTKRKRPVESRQSDNVRKAAKRACETGEETMKRQTQNKERMATIRTSETRSMALKRQAQHKQHMATVRQSETCEQTMKRQAQHKQHMASVRRSETCEQTMKRQAQHKKCVAGVRASETPGQALHRRQSNKQSMSIKRNEKCVSRMCCVSISFRSKAWTRLCVHMLSPHDVPEKCYSM